LLPENSQDSSFFKPSRPNPPNIAAGHSGVLDNLIFLSDVLRVFLNDADWSLCLVIGLWRLLVVMAYSVHCSL